MNAGKFVGRNLVTKIVLASTLTFPLWRSGVVRGEDEAPAESRELLLTNKREARRIEHRARYAADTRPSRASAPK